MGRRGGKRRRERKRGSGPIDPTNENDGNNVPLEGTQRQESERSYSKKRKINDDDDNRNDRVSVSFINDADDDNEQKGHSTTVTVPKPLSIEIESGEYSERMKVLWSIFKKLSLSSMSPSDKESTAPPSWKPTLVQRYVWPILLETSHNLVSISPTGSGKTLSYALPSVIHHHDRLDGGTILVLVPTRELVHQVASTFKKVGDCLRTIPRPDSSTDCQKSIKPYQRIKVVPIHGGVPRDGQRRAIKQAMMNGNNATVVSDSLSRTISRGSLEASCKDNESTNQNTIVLVATPGRLLDLLEEDQRQDGNMGKSSKSSIIPNGVSWIIIDEADQLTKEGDLGPQVDKILSIARSSPHCRNSNSHGVTTNPCRMVLISATYPKKCRSKFHEWVGTKHFEVTVDGMKDSKQLGSNDNLKELKVPADDKKRLEGIENRAITPKVHAEDESAATTSKRVGTALTAIPAHLEQIVHVCSEHKKPKKLVNTLKQLENKNRSNSHSKGIVFYSKIDKLRQSERLLLKDGVKCVPLHGQLSVERRQQNLNYFKRFGNDMVGKHGAQDHHPKKKKTTLILLATDVCARGVDIPRVDFVIQYDFPSNLENYAHRCGRAGRSVRGSSVDDSEDASFQSERKYVVYSFFTRNFRAMAADLVQLLKSSNSWVDPNLLELVPSHQSPVRSRVTSSKPNNAVGGKGQMVPKETDKEENGNLSYDEDEQELSNLSGNRIVLKRASHVDLESSSDEDGDDGDDDEES